MDAMDASGLREMDVEVRRENGAYYKAYVIDVFEDEVVVIFENGLPMSRFSFSEVRLAIEEFWAEDFKEGDEIEVSLKYNEEEYNGWWSGVIKMVRGNYAVVKYHGFEPEYLEILPLDWIRQKNSNPPITHTTFVKFELIVPEELREYCTKENVFRSFQSEIRAPICRYIPERGTLNIISRYEGPRKCAVMLKDMLFEDLHKKAQLLKLEEEERKELDSRIHETWMKKKDEETKHVSVGNSNARDAPVQSCSTGHDKERPDISSTKTIVVKRTRKQTLR